MHCRKQPQPVLALRELHFAFLYERIVSIVSFYGLLKGRGWTWSTAIVLCILNIDFQVVLWVGSFFSIPTDSNSFLIESIKLIVEITINIALVYYLYRHNAKVFFGKAVDVAQTSS